MTREELLKKIDFEKSWLYDCGIFGSDVDIAFHAIKNCVIEALEQEECVDCISRQAALDTFCLSEKSRKYGGDHSGYDTIMLYEVQDALEALPSVNPQEPKAGHWVKYGIPRCGEQHYKCTNCDEYFNFGLYSDYYKKAFKYCPNCGAKMIEPQESEEEE